MPCFMKMAIREAQLACPDDVAMQHEIVMAWGGILSELDLNQPPPAIARRLADLVEEKTGAGDLYVDDKREANERVLQLLPGLREMIERERGAEAGDPLALAMELAIIGNYIDRGVDIEVDWEDELANVAGTISTEVMDEFHSRVVNGAHVLILGDNTGEIVLDMLLVEELKRRGCEVTYAVRSRPVINDSTLADAIFVGMTDLCEVVESGVDTPGTVLDRVTPEFLEKMRAADILLSKGQGNFESLDQNLADVFCAFKVKCKRVARDAGLPFGSSAFLKSRPPESVR